MVIVALWVKEYRIRVDKVAALLDCARADLGMYAKPGK
jgi:hypothetical protein